MMPTYTKRTNRLYRNYVCRRTREEGWHACATKSVAAEELERLVAGQIRAVGSDPEVFEATLAAARARAAIE